LISGWNVGGHDGGYPEYTPDSRLGTWDDLAAGIKACHEIGVKVFFFVNVQPVDEDTDRYRKELYPYRMMTQHGATFQSGWGMGSLGARVGFSQRPLTSCSSGIPEYRKIIVHQMEQLAQIGADGIHIDKLCPGGLNFNSLLKMTPDRAVPEGQLSAVREIHQVCSEINKNFAISAECPWDRLLEFSGAGWAWHEVEREHTPVFKYTFPEYQPTMAANQPFDYTAVNNAVRYGYQILIGPGNYTKSMAYEPFQPLSKYIKEVIRIRQELKDTIYRGELLDKLDVHVEGDADIGYSVFRKPADSKRACILVNYAQTPRKATLDAFDGNGDGKIRVYEPYTETKSGKLPLTFNLPAERFIIVVEE